MRRAAGIGMRSTCRYCEVSEIQIPNHCVNSTKPKFSIHPFHLIAQATPLDSQERLYDRNFLIAFASQTCFVGANTLMAHYARWIEFLGGDLRQVGYIMGVLRPRV